MQTDLRLLRLPEVLHRVGWSRSSLYRAIQRGEFPAPVKLGGGASARASAWDSRAVDCYCNERIAASRKAGA
jgi:prophage regulatory protein